MKSGTSSAELIPEQAPVAGQLTYNAYLQVDALLDLQNTLSEPKAHDELLFITIHQVYELWFKQVLFEIAGVVRHLGGRDVGSAIRGVRRSNEIFRVLVQQVDILETMTPSDFEVFRSKLNPASGFQSAQFRLLEAVCGLDVTPYLRFFDGEQEWKQRIQTQAAAPTLMEVLGSLLRSEVLPGVESDTAARVAEVYRQSTQHFMLRELCEELLRFDEQVQQWRFRHVQMVERMIGLKMGTGGSPGVPYLKQTLSKRFFPELWEARSLIGGRY